MGKSHSKHPVRSTRCRLGPEGECRSADDVTVTSSDGLLRSAVIIRKSGDVTADDVDRYGHKSFLIDFPLKVILTGDTDDVAKREAVNQLERQLFCCSAARDDLSRDHKVRSVPGELRAAAGSAAAASDRQHPQQQDAEDKQKEWLFTLYSSDGSPAVTDQDLSCLLHHLREAVNASLSQPSTGSNTGHILRLHLTISPSDSTNFATTSRTPNRTSVPRHTSNNPAATSQTSGKIMSTTVTPPVQASVGSCPRQSPCKVRRQVLRAMPTTRVKVEHVLGPRAPTNLLPTDLVIGNTSSTRIVPVVGGQEKIGHDSSSSDGQTTRDDAGGGGDDGLVLDVIDEKSLAELVRMNMDLNVTKRRHKINRKLDVTSRIRDGIRSRAVEPRDVQHRRRNHHHCLHSTRCDAECLTDFDCCSSQHRSPTTNRQHNTSKLPAGSTDAFTAATSRDSASFQTATAQIPSITSYQCSVGAVARQADVEDKTQVCTDLLCCSASTPISCLNSRIDGGHVDNVDHLGTPKSCHHQNSTSSPLWRLQSPSVPLADCSSHRHCDTCTECLVRPSLRCSTTRNSAGGHKQHSSTGGGQVKPESVVVSSSHYYRRHRHRARNHNRAMKQVAEWIECGDVLGPATDHCDCPPPSVVDHESVKTIQWHNHHHVHEHYHYHYTADNKQKQST